MGTRPTEQMLRASWAVVRTRMDTLSMAYQETGAVLDHPYAFRPLDTHAKLQHGSVGRDYVAGALQNRRKSGLPRDPSRGARQGPMADGRLAGHLDVPPPATWKCSPWEVLAALGRPKQC